MDNLGRRLALWTALLLAAGMLAACGGNSSEPGGLEGQVLGMSSAAEPPTLLQGAVVSIAGPGGSQATTTDGQGRYRFDQLRPGNYGLATSYPGSPIGGKPLQSEERRFTISPGQDETISMVLLAEGITPPPAPAELPPQSANAQGAISGGGGLTSNPFFWYFLFNQPWSYGYGRAPVVMRDTTGPVVVDRQQPQQSPSGRPYSDYSPAGATGGRTKAPPEITSKGASRPGALTGASGGSAVQAPNPSAPAARPPSSGTNGASAPSTGDSKGVTRPSGGSAPSVSPPSSRPPSVRPPSVGRRR